MTQETSQQTFEPAFREIAAAAMRWPRHGGDGFAPGFTSVAATAMRWPRHSGDGFGQPLTVGR